MDQATRNRINVLMTLDTGCLSKQEAEELVGLVPSLDMDEDDLHWDAYCFLRDSGFKDLAEELSDKRPPRPPPA